MSKNNKNYVHKVGPHKNRVKPPLYLTASQKRFKDMGMVELQRELNEIFRMRRALRQINGRERCMFNPKLTVEVFRAQMADNKRVLTILLKMRKAIYDTRLKMVD